VETVVVWLVILLLLMIGFGPVYWFRPSARERRIAGMRQRALQRGLQVELAKLPDPDPAPAARVTAGGVVKDAYVECVAYRLPDWEAIRAAESNLLRAPAWRLRRTPHEVPGPAAGWAWDTSHASAGDPALRGDAGYWREARLVLDRLPGDCLALDVGALHATCFWREQATAAGAAEQVDLIADLLTQLLELQRKYRVRQRIPW
jgi:hypothetical protein